MDDLISRQAAIDAIYKCTDIFINNLPVMVDKADAYKALANLPSAQPELIEKAAYIRGFEQGRTQGMIDSQSGKK